MDRDQPSWAWENQQAQDILCSYSRWVPNSQAKGISKEGPRWLAPLGNKTSYPLESSISSKYSFLSSIQPMTQHHKQQEEICTMRFPHYRKPAFWRSFCLFGDQLHPTVNMRALNFVAKCPAQIKGRNDMFPNFMFMEYSRGIVDWSYKLLNWVFLAMILATRSHMTHIN